MGRVNFGRPEFNILINRGKEKPMSETYDDRRSNGQPSSQ
jgi:hypothetical protein